MRWPGCDHVGTDILPVVICYATLRANQRGLANIRFVVKDAQTFVGSYVPEGSVAEMHLYHPQPCHDRREAHRRLVSRRFLADSHRGPAPCS